MRRREASAKRRPRRPAGRPPSGARTTAAPKDERSAPRPSPHSKGSRTGGKLFGRGLPETELARFFRLTLDMLCVAGFDGYFKRLNPAWERTLGYTREELTARPYIEFVHPDDRSDTLAAAEGLTKGETIITFENRYRRKDGTYCWLLWTSTPVPAEGLIYATARDITPRKQAAAELQRYADEVHDLYNLAPCGYHSLDAEGVFIRMNDTELQWLGYERDEIVGKKRFPDLITPQSRENFKKNFPQFKERGHVRDLEFDMVRKDGSVFPVLLNATVVRDAAGRYLMSRSTVFDNTERKALERMKDEFISMVSHELRTPMTSIRGALALLASGRLGSLNEKGERMMRIALEDTERLIRLTNEMIDIERLELGRVQLSRQECDAGQLIAQAIDVMQPLADKAGVGLTASVAPATVWADPDRIMQTLTNLLSNAIKFSEAGTSVRVSAAPQGEQVLLQVRDEGRGIPADRVEAIFQRFHQVEPGDAREKGGTGLGLAICRAIVRQHAGRIWAESEPGAGSTFSFTLPSSEASAALIGGEEA